MNSKLFNFCFILTFSGIRSFQYDHTKNVNFSKLMNLFSSENFPKGLESISAEALSENVSNQQTHLAKSFESVCRT